MAGSVHFSQHHLGVPGTFPYSFPYPVCCEQFWQHDFVTKYYKTRKWVRGILSASARCDWLSSFVFVWHTSASSLSSKVLHFSIYPCFHQSPGTASGIESRSTLVQNYSIIRRDMWQWRYSSFYIFYHTRAIFSFSSTLIINLFIENWLTKNLWISKSIIMMNGNYHLNPESFISLFTICQVIQECMNTCLVSISQLIVIFAWTLDLYAKY